MVDIGQKLEDLLSKDKVFNNYADNLVNGIAIWNLSGVEYGDETYEPQQEISRTYRIIHYDKDESKRDDLMRSFYEVGTVAFIEENVNVDAADIPTGDIYRVFTVKIDIV